MPKAAKKKEKALADRLRDMGLPKPLAKSVARTTTNVKGQLPESARSAIKEMIAKVEERGGGVTRKTAPVDPDGAGETGSRGKAEKHAKKAGKSKAAKKAKKAKKARKAEKAKKSA
jgi:hypothetical protein